MDTPQLPEHMSAEQTLRKSIHCSPPLLFTLALATLITVCSAVSMGKVLVKYRSTVRTECTIVGVQTYMMPCIRQNQQNLCFVVHLNVSAEWFSKNVKYSFTGRSEKAIKCAKSFTAPCYNTSDTLPCFIDAGQQKTNNGTVKIDFDALKISHEIMLFVMCFCLFILTVITIIVLKFWGRQA